MSNSISKSAKGSKNVRNSQSEKQVAISRPQNSPKRVLETRDQWSNLFDHCKFLIVAYYKGQKPKAPRKGFAFGGTLECPHQRAYVQSLLAGFVTNKAGKVFKDFDGELSDGSCRRKIAYAILLDTSLSKGGVEGAQSTIERHQPKREKALALAVLEELQKQEPKGLPYYPEVTASTPKSGSSKGKGNKSKSAKAQSATPSKGGSKAQPKAEDVDVKAYIHFGTDYGVVTIPTLGKYELEKQMASNALKRYLKGQNITLKGDEVRLKHLGWSNIVTPMLLDGKQVVILKDNKKAKLAWLNGIELDDLTPLKGWKVTRKSTRKSTRKQTSK